MGGLLLLKVRSGICGTLLLHVALHVAMSPLPVHFRGCCFLGLWSEACQPAAVAGSGTVSCCCLGPDKQPGSAHLRNLCFALLPAASAAQRQLFQDLMNCCISLSAGMMLPAEHRLPLQITCSGTLIITAQSCSSQWSTSLGGCL